MNEIMRITNAFDIYGGFGVKRHTGKLVGSRHIGGKKRTESVTESYRLDSSIESYGRR